MLTGELKKILIDTIQPVITEHQKRKQFITDEDVRNYMTPHPLKFKANRKGNKYGFYLILFNFIIIILSASSFYYSDHRVYRWNKTLNYFLSFSISIFPIL